MTEPITLEEAKNQCKVDTVDDDTLITNLISTAREIAEHETGQVFITRTIELIYDSAGESIEIPYRPLAEVTKIEVISDAGVKSEVSDTLYNVDLAGPVNPGRIRLKMGCTWPEHRDFASFIITIKAGYGETAASVPPKIKQAILEIIGHLYDNRESQEIPAGAKEKLSGYRLYTV